MRRGVIFGNRLWFLYGEQEEGQGAEEGRFA